MKQNELRTVTALTSGGTKASGGAASHGATLGLVVGSKALIDADLNPLIVSNDNLLNGRGELRELRKVLIAKTDLAYDLAFAVRDSLKRSLGRTYSTNWEGTGFSQSLKIPRSVAGLQQISRSLKNFFTQHPEREVENVATAALIGAALDALTTAQTGVTVQRGAVRTLLTARKQKEKAMRIRLRGLAEELNRVIGPLDGRWDAFGLNQPGIKQRPTIPTKVSVVLIGNNAVSVKWEKSARAEYYRVWLKVNGVNLELTPIGSPADLDFTIETLPGSSLIEVALSAVNNGGESALSQVVQVTTT